MPTATPNEVGHYLRQFAPIGPETVAMYANRPSASRGNAYLNPGALSGQERARAMIFPNFDCDNAGGQRMTAVPDTADAAVLLRAAAAGVAARQHAEVPAHRPGRLREVGALPMRTPG